MLAASFVVYLLVAVLLDFGLLAIIVNLNNGNWPAVLPATAIDIGFSVALRSYLVKKVSFRIRAKSGQNP
jgi:hypothetical protein